MKMKSLLCIALFGIAVSVNAQTNTFPESGNVGIGTNTPSVKFNIFGNHYDTQFLLHSQGGGTDDKQADLMLWASESGWTYSGVGIGNNVINAVGGVKRINNVRGASYIRLLDNSMVFNVVSNTGFNRNAVSINSYGYVGIGTSSPKEQLHLASDADHSFLISRADGSYGFRILRNAQGGNVYFQIGSSSNAWETKIQIGEGEGVNTKLLFNPNGGNVGIGTTNPQNKLDVNGTIRAKEIKVETGWADFVFAPTYKLRPLSEVEQFIKTNGHLPEIPKAEEVQQNGVNLGEMQTKLLQKVEELTLYSIEQEKANTELKQQLVIQAHENLELKHEVKELKRLLMEKLK